MSTYDTPIPGASGYEQANLLARRAYENAMTRLQQRRSQSLLRHGYTRDAQGHLGVDPNNEYGGYQQMLRGEAGQTGRLERAQNASGWGSDSGYLAEARDQLQHAQGGEQAQFGQEFENELAGLHDQEQDAGFSRDQALYQNELDATRNAVDQGNFNPADYSGLDIPEYGAGNEQPPPPRPRGKPQGQTVHQRGRQQMLRRARQLQQRKFVHRGRGR